MAFISPKKRTFHVKIYVFIDFKQKIHLFRLKNAISCKNTCIYRFSIKNTFISPKKRIIFLTIPSMNLSTSRKKLPYFYFITLLLYRETIVSRYNGGRIKIPPKTSQYDSAVMVRGVSGEPSKGHASLSDGYYA